MIGARLGRSHQRRGDRGTTLVETAVVVTVLGIVLAPLALAVDQAIGTVPGSGERTARALDRSALADRFGDDVANATGVVAPSGPVPCAAGDGTTPTPLVSLPWDWDGASATGGEYARVTYQATFGPAGTDPRGLVRVALYRQVEDVNGPSPPTSQPVGGGYCATSPAPSPAVDAERAPSGDPVTDHEGVTLVLTLRDTPGDPAPTVVTLGGVLRVTSRAIGPVGGGT